MKDPSRDCGSDRKGLRCRWPYRSTSSPDGRADFSGGWSPPAVGSRTPRRSRAEIPTTASMAARDWHRSEATLDPKPTWNNTLASTQHVHPIQTQHPYQIGDVFEEPRVPPFRLELALIDAWHFDLITNEKKMVTFLLHWQPWASFMFKF